MANTKHGINSNIKVPPESTGPGINNLVRYELQLTGISGTIKEGDTILGQSSSAMATVIRIAQGGSNGDVSAFLDNDTSTEFTTGETLDFDGGAVTAVLDNFERVFTNTSTVVSGDNPFNSQNVDFRGSAFVRFSEGEQQFDAFGTSRFIQPEIIAEYQHQYSDNASKYYDDIVGGSSTVSHLPDESSVELSIGTTSGDQIERTTNLYHHYQAGSGRTIQITVASGDAGKTNVERTWGYFDDENGVFFRLNGTALSIVLRSSTTGSVVDTEILQVDWNEDTADGNGPSKFLLAPENSNIYWIDLAWLGAGQVRVGVFDANNERITLHKFVNQNTIPRPYMTTATLPIRWGISNTGTSGSTSTLKIICASVQTDGKEVKAAVNDSSSLHAWVSSIVTGVGNGSETVIGNFRAAALDPGSGLTNRKVVVPSTINWNIIDNPIIVRIYAGAVLGGSPSWAAAKTGSVLEVDTAGTLTAGNLVEVGFENVGTNRLNAPESFENLNNGLHTGADGSAGIVYVVTAECAVNAATSDVQMGLSWVDLGS